MAGKNHNTSPAGDTYHVQPERRQQILNHLAGVASGNLRGMGLGQVADAFDGSDHTDTLNGGVYDYGTTHGYDRRELLTAQRFSWPIDRIVMMATSGPMVPSTSGPLNDDFATDAVGALGTYLNSPITREQIYSMLGLHDLRDAAEVEKITHLTDELDVPSPYPGIIYSIHEMRRFGIPEVPEVDLVETTLVYHASGSHPRRPIVAAVWPGVNLSATA